MQQKINNGVNAKDLTGQRFGMLTVLGDSGLRRGHGSILWRCRCDCGGEILAERCALVNGTTVSCGCARQKAYGRTAEDLTGRRFGALTALRPAPRQNGGRVSWVCRCDCGRECTVPAFRLKNGHTASCGCRRSDGLYRRRDLTGQRFGRLTVLGPSGRKHSGGKALWHCRCDCGNEVEVLSGSLVRGMTLSCGCRNREQRSRLPEYLHYGEDTCAERLIRVYTDRQENKAGFRGLFRTKSGKYRATITFQKTHYALGTYENQADAVRARLEAEEDLHAGYLRSFRRYEARAQADPAWARDNPFFYRVTRADGRFRVRTNGE